MSTGAVIRNEKQIERLRRAIYTLNRDLEDFGYNIKGKSINEKIKLYCRHKKIQCEYNIKSMLELYDKKTLKYKMGIYESPAEIKCRAILSNNKIDFIHQHKIGKYRVDFYIPVIDTIIEIDGRKFHSGKRQLINDNDRQNFLIKSGYKILRYFPEMIDNRVIKDIMDLHGSD